MCLKKYLDVAALFLGGALHLFWKVKCKLIWTVDNSTGYSAICDVRDFSETGKWHFDHRVTVSSQPPFPMWNSVRFLCMFEGRWRGSGYRGQLVL